MSKNQNIDHEAFDLSEDITEDNDLFTEEEYLISTLNSVSEIIVSDDFYNRNKHLICNMINDLYDRHNRRGDMPPRLAGRAVEIFFSSITKVGLR